MKEIVTVFAQPAATKLLLHLFQPFVVASFALRKFSDALPLSQHGPNVNRTLPTSRFLATHHRMINYRKSIRNPGV